MESAVPNSAVDVESESTDSIRIALDEIQTNIKTEIFGYLSSYKDNGVSVLRIEIKLNDIAKILSEKSSNKDDLKEAGSDAALEVSNSLVGDISIRDLETVSTRVEKHFETKLHYTDLGEMLKMLISQFEEYEIQIFDGNILVEQGDISDSTYDDVGLWTNTMADGSEISFIGSLNIIDDVTVYMT